MRRSLRKKKRVFKKSSSFRKSTSSWKTKSKLIKKKASTQKELGNTLKNVQSHTFNSKELSRLDVADFENYEYLYFRNLSMKKMLGDCEFPMLRVIDVSFNKFKNLMFLKRMPNVRHIFASGNQIQSFFDIPLPPHVETLCLSHNQIQSFQGFDPSPTLRVLTLQKNRICDYNGFPTFGKMDSLDLRKNPVCAHPMFKRILLSCIRVHPGLKINGENLTDIEVNQVNPFDQRMFLCVKLGFMPQQECTSEDLDDFLLKWNQKNSVESIVQVHSLKIQGEAEEGKKILLSPIFRTRYGEDLNIVPFPNLTHHRFKLRCKFKKLEMILGDNFRIPMTHLEGGNEHTLTIIAPPGTYNYRYIFDGKRDKTLRNVTVVEDEPEGEDVTYDYLFVVRWLRYNGNGEFDLIGNENQLFYRPTQNDIGHVLKAEIDIVRSTDGEVVSSMFFLSDVIDQGQPSCRGLKIIGETREGDVLKGDYLYNGGIEGNSELVFYREVDEGDVESERYPDEYHLTSDDVGKRIICEFTPIREDGVRGEVFFIKSEVILMCKPKIQSLKIEGEMKDGSTLQLDYKYRGNIVLFFFSKHSSYKGGEEGEPSVTWIRTEIPLDVMEIPDEVEVVEEFTDKKNYQLSFKDVGKFINVKLIPRSTSGDVGDEVVLSTSKIGDMGPDVTGPKFVYRKSQVGQIIQFMVEFQGGLQGNSLIQWIRVKDKNDVGSAEDIKGAKEMAYMISSQDIGYFLGVRYSPLRSDGVRGAVGTFFNDNIVCEGDPVCVSLHMEGIPMQDHKLFVKTEYFGGEEGNSKFKWYRVDSDNNLFYLGAAGNNSREYQCFIDDIGHTIMCEYTPVRKNDNSEGKPCICFSEMVKAPAPVLEEVYVKYEKAEEGETFSVKSSYFGEEAGKINYIWNRVENPGRHEEKIAKIEGANGNDYKATVDDVGCKIFCKVQPIRNDGVVGEWSNAAYSKTVVPILPRVKNASIVGDLTEGSEVKLDLELDLSCPVKVDMEKSKVNWFLIEEDFEMPLENEKYSYTVRGSDTGKSLKVVFVPCREGIEIFGEKVVVVSEKVTDADPVAKYVFITGTFIEGNSLQASVKYSGGTEGDSLKEWIRIHPDGRKEKVDDFLNKPFPLTDIDVGCKIKLLYTPVRADGKVGTPMEKTTEVVQAAAKKLPGVEIVGKFKEGECLSFKIDESEMEQEIVSSSKRWYRIFDDGKTELAALEVDTYTLTKSDVGCKIKIMYTPTLLDGESLPCEVESNESVQPKDPVVLNLAILMIPHVGKTIGADYTYEGGKEGESDVRWWIGEKKNGEFEKIPHEKEKDLILNSDHLMKFVKVSVQPVREDGTKGPVTEESEPVRAILGKSTELYSNVVKEVEKRNISIDIQNGQFVLSPKQFLHKDADGNVILNEWPKKLLVSTSFGDDCAFNVEHDVGRYKLMAKNRADRDTSILLLKIFFALSDVKMVEEIFGDDFAESLGKREPLKELQFLTPKSGVERPEGSDGKGAAFDALVSLC